MTTSLRRVSADWLEEQRIGELPGVPAGALYFLIVGRDGTGVYESSWGLTSAGAQRGGTHASFQCGATTKILTDICP